MLRPPSTTLHNFLQFTPWVDAELFRNFAFSVVFYTTVTLFAVLLALNETYQLAIHSDSQRERRHFATAIAIYFLPTFAAFSAIELMKQWAAVRLDIVALITFSVANSYALGFFVTYTGFKYGFSHRYEQLVLEFGGPALAFWRGIV